MIPLTDRARVLKRRQDLYIHQGGTYRYDWVYVDDADQPIDITGYTARLQMRASEAATPVLYSATTDNGQLVIDGEAGLVMLAIPDPTNAAWVWRYGVYDLELLDPDDFVVKLSWGRVRVKPEITRDA